MASNWITPARRLGIYLRDQFQCQYCGMDLSSANRDHVGLDHLVPRTKNGTHDSDNLVCSCKWCNSSKGARHYQEYAPGGAMERIEQNRHKPVNEDLARAILEGYGPSWEYWNESDRCKEQQEG